MASVHPHLPPFPPGSSPSAAADHLHLQLLQPQFPENLTPKRSKFQTNPETCFVHGLCPPTSTPLSPTIISICPKHASYTAFVHPHLPPFPPRSPPSAAPSTSISCISPQNEACFRLTLKHASYMASVHLHLPPFPPRSSPSAATTKHV